MDRASQNPVPSIDALRQEDADPWNEFLSESEGTDAPPEGTAGADGSIRSNRPRISVVELVPARPDPADDFIPEHPAEPTASTPLVEPPTPLIDRPAPAVAAPPPPDAQKPYYASRVSPFVRPSGSRPPHEDSGLFTPPARPPGGAAAEPEAVAPPAAELPQHRATAGAAPLDVTSMTVRAEAQMQPARTTVAAAAVTTSQLSLADVVARQPAVEWPEAVAVTEELCAALLSAGERDDLLVPDLTDVFITADGAVAIRTGAAGTRDVTALGKTLNSLLMGGATPLPLRLFVTSATTPDRYRSVALFADALSYYGVPGRAELIQTLYRRANATAPPAGARGNLSVRRTAVAIPTSAAARPHSRIRPWTIAVIVLLVLASLIGYGVWRAYATSPVRVEPNTAVEGPPLRDNWLPGGILIDPSSIAEEQTPRPSSPRRPVREIQPPAASVRESAPPQAVANGNVPLPSFPTRVTAPSLPPQTMLMAERAMTPAAMSPSAAPAATPPIAVTPPAPVDPRVYSEADLDVDPPVLLSPRPTLPQRLSPNDKRPDITLELLVDRAGKVQSAKLLDQPTHFSDISELGPAKLLKFRPATRGGRPVAYKYRMRLSPAVR